MRALIALLIALFVVIIFFFLGWARVPDMLANNLSKKLGVPVSIHSMSFRPSKIGVYKLTIGNPQGYSLPKAFSSEELFVEAPVTEYFKNHVVVDEVVVNDIYLGLEFDSTSSADGNWTKIFNHYEEAADLDEEDGKKVTIKRLVCNNIQSEVLFRGEKTSRKLPVIRQIVLTNISTEGGFPTDQLMSSILGQMLREVFTQQNLGNMIKGLIDQPGKAVDKFLDPFKGMFNSVPIPDTKEYKAA